MELFEFAKYNKKALCIFYIAPFILCFIIRNKLIVNIKIATFICKILSPTSIVFWLPTKKQFLWHVLSIKTPNKLL